jgi:magnesium transporter
MLKKRAKKTGLPPGSLVHIGDKGTGVVHISILDYDVDRLIEKKEASFAECSSYLDKPSITWINICGIDDSKTIEYIGKRFGLHPLLLEDVMNTGQRSKIDNYKEMLYIVMRMLTYSDEKQETDDEQVSIVLGKNFVISFIETDQDVFAPIRERMKHPKSRIRQRGADYLCYALIDCIVDNYFLILEKVDEKLELLEDALFKHPTSRTLVQIQRVKREISLLRKAVWPMREVISSFNRIDTPLIQDSTKIYIQDVYDHTIQAIDTIESFRDISSGMLDIYLSNMSQRMNEIMKVLTVVATIFVPLTFVTSLYGMNFDNMPELHWKWGYHTVIGIMLVMSALMLYYFRRKKWI